MSSLAATSSAPTVVAPAPDATTQANTDSYFNYYAPTATNYAGKSYDLISCSNGWMSPLYALAGAVGVVASVALGVLEVVLYNPAVYAYNAVSNLICGASPAEADDAADQSANTVVRNAAPDAAPVGTGLADPAASSVAPAASAPAASAPAASAQAASSVVPAASSVVPAASSVVPVAARSVAQILRDEISQHPSVATGAAIAGALLVPPLAGFAGVSALTALAIGAGSGLVNNAIRKF